MAALHPVSLCRDLNPAMKSSVSSRKGQRMKPSPIPTTDSRFNCEACRHMWRQGLAFAIYDLIARFSHEGGAYFSSLTAMADYFGASYDSVHQAVQWLLKNGWIELVGHAPPSVVEDREGLRILRKHKSRS